LGEDLLDHRPLEDGRNDLELAGAAVRAVVDACGRDTQGKGQAIHAQAERRQVVLPEYFPGVHRPHAVDRAVHRLSSVGVDDRDAGRTDGGRHRQSQPGVDMTNSIVSRAAPRREAAWR
jgi:hypothetical protein